MSVTAGPDRSAPRSRAAPGAKSSGRRRLGSPGAPETRDREAPRRVVIFVVVSLALLMSSIDQTIVATALHTLQHGLGTSIAWAGWTITIYSLGQLLMLPVAGKLSNHYGRRRVFLVSVAVFTVASLACGLANDIYLLVVLRAVQAIGGAGFTPSATGIVVDYFGDARDRAVGLFGSIFPLGAIIGPVLGGLFVAYWSWRGIFYVNVPVGATLFCLCLRYVPRDTRGGAARRPLDVTGMALLGVGLLAGMLGLTYLGGAGGHPSSPRFFAPEAAAALAFGFFVRHTRRTSDPFIPPRLLHGQGFGVMNLINVLYGGAAAGLGALIPLYATQRYGLTALDSGTLLAGRGIAVIVFASLAAIALRRTGYRRPMLAGFLLTAAGMLALAAHPIGLPPYTWLAAAAVLTGIGIGCSGPATRNASLQLAPDESAGIAALRSAGRQAGSITAISIATAMLAQAHDPGLTQAHIYAIFGLILIAALPFITRVPEHRGTW